MPANASCPLLNFTEWCFRRLASIRIVYPGSKIWFPFAPTLFSPLAILPAPNYTGLALIVPLLEFLECLVQSL